MASGAFGRPVTTALPTGFDDALRTCLAATAARHPSNHLFTALSGGPDSMALACLAQDYAARHGLRHTALIVDHRIRDDSTAEAHHVAAGMRGFGVMSEILTVGDEAPSTGIQAWARERRYELLLARVRREGGCLLLGHHAGDQAETVMMRLSRGSGLTGLAGMRAVSQREGVMILRPLLEMSAQSLIAHCRATKAGFVSDPSNRDPRFERVRVRDALAAMDMAGSAMSDKLRRLARAAGAIDDALMRALTEKGFVPAVQPSGHMVLPPAVAELPLSVAARVLAHVIGQVARPKVPPAMRALRHLAVRLSHDKAATLGGARFSLHEDAWLVTAEIGRRPPRLRVRGGERVIFAGMWQIASPVDAMIRHLGEAGSGGVTGWADRPGWCALPSLVRRSVPVLETLDGALLYPHLHSKDTCDEVIVAASARFLPMSFAKAAYRN
ncbi:MAG: tRNA lysidine(34) synthetase TilS [Rhodobiaceae bacterium]